MIEGHQGFHQQWAHSYRRLDEGAGDDAIDHYRALLRQLSGSFDRQIDALDIGCGTGRYFHCLRNVRCLIGLDPSASMLEQARSPVRADEIRIDSIELRCGDLSSSDFTDGSFDFIYSIGVVGEYAPIDAALLSRCLKLLKPGGILLLTAVDCASRVAVPETGRPSLLRRIARKSWPSLPVGLRVMCNRWLSPRYVTRAQVERLFATSGYPQWDVSAYAHRGGWIGTHLDCVAHKGLAAQ